VAPTQSLAEPTGVHTPVIVRATVNQDHRYLFGVTVGQLKILENGHFAPFHPEILGDGPDDVTGRVAQVTAWLTDQDDAGCGPDGTYVTFREALRRAV
jgi:hypothetical protein